MCNFSPQATLGIRNNIVSNDKQNVFGVRKLLIPQNINKKQHYIIYLCCDEIWCDGDEMKRRRFGKNKRFISGHIRQPPTDTIFLPPTSVNNNIMYNIATHHQQQRHFSDTNQWRKLLILYWKMMAAPIWREILKKIDFFWDNDNSINDLGTLDAAPAYAKQNNQKWFKILDRDIPVSSRRIFYLEWLK